MNKIDANPAKSMPLNGSFDEWPTWLLVGGIYCSWYLTMANFHQIHWLIATPLLTLILTLHSSLCHELIHGHPSRNQTLNNLLGYPSFGLIYPYTIFKETHLKHHDNGNITYPGIDPESFFIGQQDWGTKNNLSKIIAWANMTLAGRWLMGPGISFIGLVKNAVHDIRYAKFNRKLMWVSHYGLIATMLYVAYYIFEIQPMHYAIMAYFSLSIIQLRSFFEHRPVESIPGRSVIQEAASPMGFLFLNNNYHYTHHQHPGLAWYRLKKEYLANKQKYLEENGNFHYAGYLKWFKYLFTPIHSPVHPFL